MIHFTPTPYPDVNTLLHELLENIRLILGDHLIGMYLDGSLASGDFDQDSDIDFVVVTDEEISSDLFAALQAMHDRLATLDSIWAIQLEGTYISAQALRRYDPALVVYPNIERGQGERLKLVRLDATWNVHRYILRERGIVLTGPAPQTLVDFVSPDDLRLAMEVVLNEWAVGILDHPEYMKSRGYQSYVVLSLCRILYTLQHDTVASKPAAARWAQANLNPSQQGLIERAWVGRHHPDLAAAPEDVNGTLEFIRYVQTQSPKA